MTKEQIDRVVEGYDKKDIRIGTICSHSALQIFHGARQEGFKTIGICTKDRVQTYKAFPWAMPDEFMVVDKFSDILQEEKQEFLRERNTVIVPHGSFVQYVGANNIEESFNVPLFGNRMTLGWENDRKKQRKWIEGAGIKMPKEYPDASKVDSRVFVKFSGARGGRGFFSAGSKEDLERKLAERVASGIIDSNDAKNAAIQEFVPGVRYYFQYFYSPFEESIGQLEKGRVELLGIDKRIETIDEAYRGLPEVPPEFFDYTVTGNQPVVIRESLLPDVMDMGVKVVARSKELFAPGMQGAFCLETVYHPDRGFTVFEVSARIVAGSNLYTQGSPYSSMIFNEPMSTGRRIAREMRSGMASGELEEIIY